MDDSRILELESRLRALESLVDRQLSASVLGSKDDPVRAIYLREDRKNGVAKITFHDTTTPAVRVEKVR